MGPGGKARVSGSHTSEGRCSPWATRDRLVPTWGQRGGAPPGSTLGDLSMGSNLNMARAPVEGSPGWGRQLPLSLSAWLAGPESRSAHSRSEFSGNRSRGAVGGGQRGKWSPASGSQGGCRGPSPPGPPTPGGAGPGCAATEPPARVVELVPGKGPCIVGGLLLSTSWGSGSHDGEALFPRDHEEPVKGLAMPTSAGALSPASPSGHPPHTLEGTREPGRAGPEGATAGVTAPSVPEPRAQSQYASPASRLSGLGEPPHPWGPLTSKSRGEYPLLLGLVQTPQDWAAVGPALPRPGPGRSKEHSSAPTTAQFTQAGPTGAVWSARGGFPQRTGLQGEEADATFCVKNWHKRKRQKQEDRDICAARHPPSALGPQRGDAVAGGLWPSRWTLRPGAGRALTPGVPAGQAAVQGLGVDVEGAVELLAVPLAAPLQVAQQVTEPDAQGCPGVPELGHEAHKGQSGPKGPRPPLHPAGSSSLVGGASDQGL